MPPCRCLLSKNKAMFGAFLDETEKPKRLKQSYPAGADMVRLGIQTPEERLKEYEAAIEQGMAEHDCHAGLESGCEGCEFIQEDDGAISRAADHHKKQMDLIKDLIK